MKIEVKQSWIDTIPCHLTVRRGEVLEGAINQYQQALSDWATVALRIIDNQTNLRCGRIVVGGQGQ